MGMFAKPILPRVNTGSALWRQCIFAVACGFDKGAAGLNLTPESLTAQRGVTAAATPAGIYTVKRYGWGLAGSVGAVNVQRWADTGNRYDLPSETVGAVTVAALTRTNVDSVTADGIVIAKRDADGTSNAGWAMQMRNTLGDPWAFEVCDGAGGENRAQAVTEPQTTQSHMLVGRFSLVTNLIEIFVNGIREAQTATSIVSLPNTNEPISLFNYDANAAANAWDGNLGMVAVWKRALTNNEILRLYTDPFKMWKPQHREFMFGPGAGQVGATNFFLTF